MHGAQTEKGEGGIWIGMNMMMSGTETETESARGKERENGLRRLKKRTRGGRDDVNALGDSRTTERVTMERKLGGRDDQSLARPQKLDSRPPARRNSVLQLENARYHLRARAGVLNTLQKARPALPVGRNTLPEHTSCSRMKISLQTLAKTPTFIGAVLVLLVLNLALTLLPRHLDLLRRHHYHRQSLPPPLLQRRPRLDANPTRSPNTGVPPPAPAPLHTLLHLHPPSLRPRWTNILNPHMILA